MWLCPFLHAPIASIQLAKTHRVYIAPLLGEANFKILPSYSSLINVDYKYYIFYRYASTKYALAYSMDSTQPAERVNLNEGNPAEILANYVHQRGDRLSKFPYKRVEIYWPFPLLQVMRNFSKGLLEPSNARCIYVDIPSPSCLLCDFITNCIHILWSVSPFSSFCYDVPKKDTHTYLNIIFPPFDAFNQFPSCF